ncbi:hypothetical protein KM043_015342 [Ampulex compressa]|nr:hypothetical protein KM043_015342 [Ampulex compressa]
MPRTFAKRSHFGTGAAAGQKASPTYRRWATTLKLANNFLAFPAPERTQIPSNSAALQFLSAYFHSPTRRIFPASGWKMAAPAEKNALELGQADGDAGGGENEAAGK